MMLVDMKNLVSITEANRNFSKIARAVDENGSVVILKNNAPKYVIISYDQIDADEQVSDEQLLEISRKSFKRHEAAYKKLAKGSASKPSKLCSSIHTSLKYREAQWG